MMVWKMYLLSNISILGIYVSFQGRTLPKTDNSLLPGSLPKRKVVLQPSISGANC